MIPLWLLTKLPFLTRIGPLLGKYGIRIALVFALAGALFIGGCQYANVQHAEHLADIEKQKTVAIAERTAELNAEWRAKLLIEENARMALQFDLNIVEDRETELLARIGNLQLTKTIDQVNIEACLETEDENIKLVIANPFTAEWARLYNDSSRVVRAGDTPEPETD